MNTIDLDFERTKKDLIDRLEKIRIKNKLIFDMVTGSKKTLSEDETEKLEGLLERFYDGLDIVKESNKNEN